MSANSPRPGQQPGWNGPHGQQFPQQPRPVNPPPGQRPGWTAPHPQGFPPQGYAPQSQGYAPQSQGYAPQSQGYAPQPQAVAPKQRKKWPIVVACVVLVPLLLVGIWLGYFLLPAKGPGSLAKQWAAMQSEVPGGQIVAMELRAGPANADRGMNKVDWLDLYWVDGDSTYYLTHHPYDEDKSGVVDHVKFDGYQNTAVTSEDLAQFQAFTDAIQCAKDEFRATRMIKLPDGFPIFSGTCSAGWNNQLTKGDTIQLGDQPYDPKTTMDVILAAAEIGSHMDFELAKLTLNSKNEVSIESCIADVNAVALNHRCHKRVVVNTRIQWPQITVSAGRPDGFTWPAVFEPHRPPELGSAALRPETLDKTKLEARLNQLAQAGIQLGDPTTNLTVMGYKDGFALAAFRMMTGEFVAVDQDGNVISK